MPNRSDTNHLLQRWREHIGRRRSRAHQRPLAALGYLLTPGKSAAGLLELRDVTLVLLYDEPIGRRFPALRLVGYGALEIAHGVLWGGSENCHFYKDLRVEPEFRGTGLALNSGHVRLFRLALRLHAELHSVDRFQPRQAHNGPRLPRLWASFAPVEAASLGGDGPEFTALCQRFDLSPEVMFAKFKREHRGLVCVPLEWVSGELRRSLGVFVDLDDMPRRQVFRLRSFPTDLQGFQGAAEYDFYHSGQREHFEHRLTRWRTLNAGRAQNTAEVTSQPASLEAALSR